MLNNIIYKVMMFFFYWFAFAFLGAILLVLRTDFWLVKMDVKKIVFKQKLWITIMSSLFVFLVLPLTIPFSIKNIINNK